jgi:hypothetical protein
MKASAFPEAQKAFILKQGADGVPVAEICRRAGISQATYFNWQKEARRPAADGDEAAEADRRREGAAEEVGGGPVAGPGAAPPTLAPLAGVNATPKPNRPIASSP